MKTLINSILGLTLCVLTSATFINAEVACAIMAASGILTIAVNDYSARRDTVTGLVA
jgi:hypothetical protein